MLDINDPKTSNDESQQLASENNANTTYVNNDSDYASQPNAIPKELDDSTIYDNMIFPS
ncbi:MAG: hypothetical protein H6Q68_1197 [Firmicutes bacterium]|nr:hypothetical protein [Bacillota bacterium]